MIKIKRALISVSDKTGVIEFARKLHSFGVEILSTGGTARLLKGHKIPVKEVSETTGFPEILNGRVKTLHPNIHAGLLALRDKKDHMEQLKKMGIRPIDMVVVNLYPFQKVIKKKGVTLDEAIENIDIGGPTMLRSAAKNYKSVAVISNPDNYKDISDELERNSGILSDSVLFNLAIAAFGHCAQYDKAIHTFLNRRLKGEDFSTLPQDMTLHFSKVKDLRYGENPHQSGSFYKDEGSSHGLPAMKQLHGKELSFNNMLDLNAAISFIKDFDSPAAVIIKHNNPTGIATDKTLANAFTAALSCDPISAFGGIIALNRKVDNKTAQAIIKGGFMECIIAPEFQQGALKLLSKKKNIRLLTINLKNLAQEQFDLKKVNGGLLLQEVDVRNICEDQLNVVTKIKPTKAQLASLLFGWRLIKNIKSNAIVLVKGSKTVGIGCGQTSRIESAKIAIKKAGSKAQNSLLISDAFIPKTDTVQIAAKAGIKAIIQTGGSIQDQNVIKAADRAKIAMVLTGARHFKH